MWYPVLFVGAFMDQRNESRMKREKTNKINNQMFIINFCLDMFRASLCPSSGEQRPCYCLCDIQCPLWVLLWFNEMYLVRRERKPTRSTIRCLLSTSVWACFGHHYAHLQENKDRVTAYGVLRWFCWMWLVVVVGALRCRMRAVWRLLFDCISYMYICISTPIFAMCTPQIKI